MHPPSAVPSARFPAPRLRLLVALLAALQLAGPATAAFAESPPAPTVHADHIGRSGDSGCATFHDELFCLSCRVLSTEPAAGTDTALPAATVERWHVLYDRSHPLPARADLAPSRARGPPPA